MADILLVEDNMDLQQINQRLLEKRGYNTRLAMNLSEARVALAVSAPDLIVLDIELPDGSGLDFVRELRERENSDVPVLFLTVLTTKEDILHGLKSGGDDYLTKPYDFDILLTRVEALLRRAKRVPEVIVKGRLSLDVTADVATLDGTDLLLTQKEFALLLVFVQNERRFIGAEYLYERVWKASMAGGSGAVRKTVSALRGKIKNSGWMISWSNGEGYFFGRE